MHLLVSILLDTFAALDSQSLDTSVAKPEPDLLKLP
jgi:hypothetical protein